MLHLKACNFTKIHKIVHQLLKLPDVHKILVWIPLAHVLNV